MPPDTFPYGSSVKGGALNRNSADDGSGRSDILMDVSCLVLLYMIRRRPC